MPLTIRPYQPSDLEAMKQITVEAFDGVSIDRNIEDQFGLVNGHDWQWRKARHIDEDVRRQPASAFVAESDGVVVGYITTFADRMAGIGLIPNLAVRADVRGQGLGRQLILHALEYFRREGLTHARIETLDQNSVGQRLYPSLGFRQVARQIHYCVQLRTESSPGER